MTHVSISSCTYMAAEITRLCVWWQVCLAVFDLCFIRGLGKMLLSWKTCHGANTLHREGVCTCVFLCLGVSFLTIPLCYSMCKCVCKRESVCAIIRPVPCWNLFACSGKQAGILSSQCAQIFRDTLQWHTLLHWCQVLCKCALWNQGAHSNPHSPTFLQPLKRATSYPT